MTVDAYIEFYIAGIEIMNRLQVDFPEIYGDLFKLERSCKRDDKAPQLSDNERFLFPVMRARIEEF